MDPSRREVRKDSRSDEGNIYLKKIQLNQEIEELEHDQFYLHKTRIQLVVSYLSVASVDKRSKSFAPPWVISEANKRAAFTSWTLTGGGGTSSTTFCFDFFVALWLMRSEYERQLTDRGE